ncbi:MAG: hypothetical protein ABSA86_08615 [Oryzomonas sp.]|jgi:hypothetical protein
MNAQKPATEQALWFFRRSDLLCWRVKYPVRTVPERIYRYTFQKARKVVKFSSVLYLFSGNTDSAED